MASNIIDNKINITNNTQYLIKNILPLFGSNHCSGRFPWLFSCYFRAVSLQCSGRFQSVFRQFLSSFHVIFRQFSCAQCSCAQFSYAQFLWSFNAVFMQFSCSFHAVFMQFSYSIQAVLRHVSLFNKCLAAVSPLMNVFSLLYKKNKP